MNIISADFNARTEIGHLRLNSRGSQEDLRDQGIQVGDWIWLSDGELVVGAQLAVDDRYGIVGVPRWNTLVHLDDEDLQEVSVVQNHFVQLLQQPSLDSNSESRVFQLLTILEKIIPPSMQASLSPGYFSERRAGALHFLGELELAILELDEALLVKPDDPDLSFFYLETLRKIDLDRAAIEAGRRAELKGVSAAVLAACINIRSAVAERYSDQEFSQAGLQILDWVARFERAPGRDQVRASILAQVQFNQGLTLLRLGRVEEAKAAFGRAHAIDPSEPAIDEASGLESFADRARDIAARVREKPPLIAA